jgi:hypothetical protein
MYEWLKECAFCLEKRDLIESLLKTYARFRHSTKHLFFSCVKSRAGFVTGPRVSRPSRDVVFRAQGSASVTENQVQSEHKRAE